MEKEREREASDGSRGMDDFFLFFSTPVWGGSSLTDQRRHNDHEDGDANDDVDDDGDDYDDDDDESSGFQANKKITTAA